MQLTILSHNAFWFQGAPYEPPLPGAARAEIAERLAALYRRMPPDVVCLQEVQDKAAFEMIKRLLDMEGVYCSGAEHPQYGGAVFWRSGRPGLNAFAAGLHPQRMWQVAETNGRLPACSIANVHLASWRQLGEEAAACSRIDDLNGLLQTVPRPLVIAGDFNEGPQGTATAFLMQHGYLDTAVLTGQEIASTGVNKDRSDQVWVHESIADRVTSLVFGSWDDLDARALGLKSLSDHLPLWTTLDL